MVAAEFDGREFTDKARSFLYDPRRSRVAWLLLKAVRDGVLCNCRNLSPRKKLMSMLDNGVRKLPGNGNGKGTGYGSLESLLDELETDPRVAELLGGVPIIREPGGHARAGASVADRSSERTEAIPAMVFRASRVGEVSYPQVVYRDKDDVTTILNLTRLVIVMAVLIVASAVTNIYQYYRRPDRIVVDGSSGRVLSINDRNYGKEEGVEFGPDRLTSQDKLYITREFVRYLYQVDPATRPRDVEKALTMMVPDSAVKFAKWMKERGILDQQKAESWQASWSPMDVAVDPNDPYTVNVIGKQEINKVVAGAVQKETKQLRLTIKLAADNKGRADRNLRSGFLISYLDSHELNDSSAVASPETQLSGAGAKSVTPITALQDRQ